MKNYSIVNNSAKVIYNYLGEGCECCTSDGDGNSSVKLFAIW